MIYAVGVRLRYEQAFSAGPAVKRGMGGDYAGGFVFRTAEDARTFLAGKGLTGTHMVMGVAADWDTDTEMAPGEPWRRLSRDAMLVRL